MVPVPVLGILLGPSKLIPEAYPNHIGRAIEHGGHRSQARQPHLWVKILVPEEPIAVELAATPPWLAYVVVQNHHYIVLTQAAHHHLQVFKEVHVTY